MNPTEGVDLQRWFNELTHKYVAIVQSAARHSWRPSLMDELELTYEELLYGDARRAFDEEGKQLPRKRDNKHLQWGMLLHFSHVLEAAKEELAEFVKLNEE